MFSVKVTVSPTSGLPHAVARSAAEQALNALGAFYRANYAHIPVQSGRLRESLQRGQPDNIAEVVDGPRGPVARYGSRVPYAKYVRRIPKPTKADLQGDSR